MNNLNTKVGIIIMEDLYIGGISGIVSRSCTAPIELWKIQRQNPFMPNSTLAHVYRNEGIYGLWKGNGTNCLRIFPQLSINYYIYHKTRRELERWNMHQDMIHFLSGASAGFVSMVSVYPLETIRSRLSLQSNKNHYTGIVHAIRKMSFPEFYRGMSISILGFVPFNALNFMFYHKIKNRIGQGQGQGQGQPHISILIHLLCGGFAGAFSLMVTYPTDLLRRRMHIQGFDKHVPDYKSIGHAMRSIYFLDGIPGFYKGFLPGCIKIFPTIAIQFATMEYLRYHHTTSSK
jgi:solute carrier family 25 phosphate transporter 23/24/25/41